MNKEVIINKISTRLKKDFLEESTGHDWYHFERVWKMAKFLQEKEGGDLFLIELAALLHDFDDWKFKDSKNKTKELLEEVGVDAKMVERVLQVIKQVSFKGEGEDDRVDSIEVAIIQDADRLDAIGAIGIGRTFTYGGSKNREMYNPEKKVLRNQKFNQYKKSQSTTINHFYEKLLLLEGRLKTKTAKKIAESRHKFIEEFLKQFLKEWNLKDLDEI